MWRICGFLDEFLFSSSERPNLVIINKTYGRGFSATIEYILPQNNNEQLNCARQGRLELLDKGGWVFATTSKETGSPSK
jgi:hypothetical protein